MDVRAVGRSDEVLGRYENEWEPCAISAAELFRICRDDCDRGRGYGHSFCEHLGACR